MEAYKEAGSPASGSENREEPMGNPENSREAPPTDTQVDEARKDT